MAIENHWFQQSILIMKFVVCSDLIKDVLAQKCESVNLVTRSVVTPEMWELKTVPVIFVVNTVLGGP